MEILDKPLLKALINEDIPFYEVMNMFNIKTTILFNVPTRVLGFVYLSRRGYYHLLLNGSVSYETQCKVFIHEIKHITYDMPKIAYRIGLNMQHSFIEQSADETADNIYKTR